MDSDDAAVDPNHVRFDYLPQDMDRSYAEEIVRLNVELARHKSMLHSATRQILALRAEKSDLEGQLRSRRVPAKSTTPPVARGRGKRS